MQLVNNLVHMTLMIYCVYCEKRDWLHLSICDDCYDCNEYLMID